MAKLKLSAPWIIFYKEIEAMFKFDPAVKVIYDEDKNEVKLYVEGAQKADALTQLLPTEKAFGNVVMKITVVPANKLKAVKEGLYEAAFEGNSALSYVRSATGIFTNPITYVVFKKEVVQFWTDDLGDINGLRSTLYQDIAKDIFGETQGIFFCTDDTEEINAFECNNNGLVVGMPLGEWP